LKKKLNNYLKIMGIINSMFRPQKTLKKRRINLYIRPFQHCYKVVKIGPLKQETQEELQQQRWNRNLCEKNSKIHFDRL
jgi:hypothetical protein